MNAQRSSTPKRSRNSNQVRNKVQPKALFDSEGLLLSFLEQSSHAVLLTDESGTIRIWNHACEDITGLSRKKVLGKSFWALIYQLSLPEHRTTGRFESIKAAIVEALETGRSPYFGKARESIILSGSREKRLIQGLPLLIRIGNGTCIAVTAWDITRFRQAEEKIQESEARFNAIVQNSPTGIVIVDDALRFCHVNDEICRMVGYSSEELLGREFNFLVDEASRDLVVNCYQRRQKGEAVPTRYEYDIVRKDGQKRRVAMNAALTKDKTGRPFTIAHVEDITEQRQIGEKIVRRTLELEAIAKISAAMREAQTRTEIFSVLLEQSTELLEAGGGALVSYDPTGGKSKVEVSSLAWANWTNNFSPPFKDLTERVIQTGRAYRGEPEVGASTVEPLGQIGYAVCVPLIASTQTVGALWIGRSKPITDEDFRLLVAIANMAANAIHRQTLHEDLLVQLENLRQTQARLLQSEKLAAIGRLISGVAHELNNPLTSVILFSQLVQREIQDPLAKQNMAKVVSEAMRAGKIVRGLLDFARQRPIERQLVDINTVLTSSLDLVSYELLSRNITITLDLAPDLPLILADPYQLQQVFINLLQNAWQAVSAACIEGHIRIRIEVAPSGFETPASEENKVVRIQVQDNGPGISGDILNRIFDPFFTTKPEGEGTGLGLSVCHGIVTEHGGHIWAESIPGGQTTFIIELPIPPLDEVGEKKDVADLQPALSGMKGKILIIDDEPNVKDVLAQTLRKRGYQVDAVSNGTDGLERLAQSTYAHILCDIRMPGLTGVEFYQQVKTSDPESIGRIIFVTGDTTNAATRRFIEENHVHYLVKPFELNDLFQAIQMIEEEKR